MANTQVSEERKAPVVSLSPRDCRLRESAGNVFRIIAPLGSTPERIMESSFYSTVCHQFRPNDELIVLAADRTFHARLLVLETGVGYCAVHQLAFTQLPALVAAIGENLPSNHKIIYAGPEDGWQAIRNSDSVVIVSRAQSQEACLAELCQHASLRK